MDISQCSGNFLEQTETDNVFCWPILLVLWFGQKFVEEKVLDIILKIKHVITDGDFFSTGILD